MGRGQAHEQKVNSEYGFRRSEGISDQITYLSLFDNQQEKEDLGESTELECDHFILPLI